MLFEGTSYNLFTPRQVTHLLYYTVNAPFVDIVEQVKYFDGGFHETRLMQVLLLCDTRENTPHDMPKEFRAENCLFSMRFAPDLPSSQPNRFICHHPLFNGLRAREC